MTTFKTVFVHAARPHNAEIDHGRAAAIQFILENGEGLTAVMSGQGMAQLAREIERFLAEHPVLAATESPKSQ
jgi:hypothetical protein